MPEEYARFKMGPETPAPDHEGASGRPRFEGYWQKGREGEGARYFVASRPLTGGELRRELGLAPSASRWPGTEGGVGGG